MKSVTFQKFFFHFTGQTTTMNTIVNLPATTFVRIKQEPPDSQQTSHQENQIFSFVKIKDEIEINVELEKNEFRETDNFPTTNSYEKQKVIDAIMTGKETDTDPLSCKNLSENRENQISLDEKHCYECSICDATFLDKSGMHKHFSLMHGKRTLRTCAVQSCLTLHHKGFYIFPEHPIRRQAWEEACKFYLSGKYFKPFKPFLAITMLLGSMKYRCTGV